MITRMFRCLRRAPLHTTFHGEFVLQGGTLKRLIDHDNDPS